MNSITVVGRMTSDPVQKNTQSGIGFTQFDIADNYFYAGSNKVMYHRCRTFGKISNILSKCKKGTFLLVSGKMNQFEYNDKTYHEIIVGNFDFVNADNNNSNNNNSNNINSNINNQDEIYYDIWK